MIIVHVTVVIPDPVSSMEQALIRDPASSACVCRVFEKDFSLRWNNEMEIHLAPHVEQETKKLS